MALFAVSALAGCAESEEPIDVPEHVQQGVLAVLTAVDPDVDATFTGETCDTKPLSDPPDDHRWRLSARVDGTPDELRAAALKLGWQPERAEDGTLVLANHHQFGEPVDLVVRADGTVRMVVEKDCTTYERSELNLPGAVEAPELTGRQGERLDAMLDEVDDTLAAVERELGVRPKEGVHVEDKQRRAYGSCSAGKRSGARWSMYDVVYAEVTAFDDLGPAADALVAAADGWAVVKREEYVDTKDNRGVDLELRSSDGSTTLTADIDFWGSPEATDGVRLHVTSGRTECVAVDAE
ncbi:hypothetical protein [Actinophytocola sp. KF-1]